MSLFLAVNYPGGTTTLGSALNSTSTTITVATGTGANFPAPAAGQYIVLTLNNASPNLVNEIVWCTAIVGDTLTVIRGQEGTVAQPWMVGAIISNLWTAGQAETLVQQSQLQIQATNSGQDAGAVNAPAVTLNPAPASLASIKGAPIRVLDLAFTNTGNMTLSVNTFLNTPLLLPGGGQITAGTLQAGQTFEANFDGSFFELTSLPSSLAPSGPAGGSLTGTYPNPLIASNAVVNAMLAKASSLTVKGNLTGSTANVTDVTVAALGAALVTIADTNPGYVQVGPLILNKGTYSLASSTGSSDAVTFALAFPTAAIGAWIAVDNSASQMIGYTGLTQSGMTVNKGVSDSNARTGIYYALGF